MSLSEKDRHALAFIAQRAAYYANTGTWHCAECGKTPEKQPVFNKLMSCGHPWNTVWRPKA